MARSRNIKPGFFSNDVLADCDPLARLLFIGLWTVADCNGILENRPRKIKAELLPYDDCDIEQLLNQLVDKKFIEYFEVDGVGYFHVIKFKEHQHPHHKEQPKHPTPLDVTTSPRQAPDKSETSTELAPNLPQSNPSDSLILNTDSLTPYTDTLSNKVAVSVSEKSNGKPTLEAVREYCLENAPGIDASAFYDYYQSQGWKKSNGRPVKDWQACVRTWKRKGNDKVSDPHLRSMREAL